jgi:hypothetical protein
MRGIGGTGRLVLGVEDVVRDNDDPLARAVWQLGERLVLRGTVHQLNSSTFSSSVEGFCDENSK